MSTIFIAGGSGLIGRNLTTFLINEGRDVLSSYNRSKPPIELNQFYTHYDFTRYEDCLKATKGIHTLIMSVSRIGGAQFLHSSATAALLPNLSVVAGLLEAAAMNHVMKVFLLSSSTVYHEKHAPISEEEFDLNKPPCPLYFGVGWYNRYLEQLGFLYNQQYGMQIYILRLSNIYGPHANFSENKSHVLPALIKRALTNQDNIFTVWGRRDVVRDFLFVDDLSRDISMMLSKNNNEKYPVILNVGFGQGITIEEAAQTILHCSGRNIPMYFDEKKLSAKLYNVLSINKLNAYLGARRQTSFEKGISKTIEWYQTIMNKTSFVEYY